MSNFKVTFTLKQHTPIIHFQANQAGATLRATELKPKFDRFLKKYAFDGNIPDKFKIDKEKEAFNYKIKITSNITNNQIKYKTYISKRERDNNNIKEGSYFGDNSALEINDIKIEFFSFHNELIQNIKEYFIDFILVTNFGTRQNKGFGSFEVVKQDDKPIKDINFNKIFLQYYSTVYYKTSNNPLKQIQQDYQTLKSGTNRPYKKSLLFEYMCNDQIKWEKRMIKEYMRKDYPNVFRNLKYERQPIKCQNENQNYDFKYIRGLLGIAEQIEFLKNNARNFKDKIRISIKSVDKDIERFKSPITFKVINNTIYVLATNNIPVKGKKFKFRIKGEQGYLNEAIEIPQNFNIFKFLNFTMPKLQYKILKAKQ